MEQVNSSDRAADFIFFFKDIGYWPVPGFKRISPPVYLWVFQYFGVLSVYNLVISLGVYLMSF
jgi:hypothetical protein